MYASRLERILKSSTQKQIADEIGVDQPYISRVLNRAFHRRVGHYATILAYLDAHGGTERKADSLSAALRKYVRRGGNESVLVRMIELLGESQGLRK